MLAIVTSKAIAVVNGVAPENKILLKIREVYEKNMPGLRHGRGVNNNPQLVVRYI